MTTIRLIGRPALERGGQELPPPRGHKAWALLAYVVLGERAPSRRHLATLLFGEADDPLGALHWCLSQLRRAGGGAFTLTGDPLFFTKLPTTNIDVLELAGSGPLAATDHPGELLEGIDPHLGAELGSWLLIQRHRAAGLIEARMRQTALHLLTSGRAGEAVPYAARAVACHPLDEGAHELLVHCLSVAGDRSAALRQVAVCSELFHRELGLEVSAALSDAATLTPPAATGPAVGGRAAASSQLTAGRAAIIAGATEAGIQCLRRAVVESEQCGDRALQARALVSLGSALVHAVRGRDQEGAVALRQSLTLLEQSGDRATAVTAHRELAFVEVQAGRRTSAAAWLDSADQLASTPAERAAVWGVRGMDASDHSNYVTALTTLGCSVEWAASAGDDRQRAWSLSALARTHLLRGEVAEASAAAARSTELARQQRWLAFLPWPLTVQAELDLYAGDAALAAERFEQAWELGCQVNDPCWQGLAARGLGLLSIERDASDQALRWMTAAVSRCRRVSDQYQWLSAYVLDAAICAQIAAGHHDAARSLLVELVSIAARCDLRELSVRALLHASTLGGRAGEPLARELAATIDSPLLATLVEAHGAR